MTTVRDVMVGLAFWAPALIAGIGWAAGGVGWPRRRAGELERILLTGCRRISGADRQPHADPAAHRAKILQAGKAVTVAVVGIAVWASIHSSSLVGGLAAPLAIVAVIVAAYVVQKLGDGGFAIVAGLLLLVVGRAAWGAVVGLLWWLLLPAELWAVYLVGARTPKAGDYSDPMLDPDRWVRALRAVNPTKLAAKDKEGRWLNPFTVAPKLRTNEWGDMAYTVRLPQGVTAGECESKADLLIHTFNLRDVPRDHWRVEMDGEVGKLKVTILAPLPKLEQCRPPWLDANRRWTDPFAIARNERGRDVPMGVKGDAVTLIAGQSGSGKTWLLRVIVAFFAGIPGVILWTADGKDKRGCDWSLIRHRAARSVGLHDDDRGLKYLQLLEDALTEMDRRYKAGGSHPLLLLLLEEYAGLRDMLGDDDRAGKVAKARADSIVRQLAQRCRDANMHLIIATQHPNATLIPTAIRDQAATRIVGHMPAMSAQMVLGWTPSPEDMPTKEQRGHMLVDIDGVLTKAYSYALDDAEWEAFCASLPSVQPPTDTAGTDMPDDVPEAASGVQDAPTAEDPPARSATFLAAGAIVQGSALRRLDAGTLHALLPEDVRPPTQQAMSKELVEQGWRQRGPYSTVGPDGKTGKERCRFAADFETLLAGGVPDYSDEATRRLLDAGNTGTPTPDAPVFSNGSGTRAEHGA